MNTDIGFYIRKLDHLVRRTFHSHFDRKQLDECTIGNMWVIDFLMANQERDVFQKEIEERFSINRATVSKMLKLMEEKGLITRVESESDARFKKLALTERGIALQALGAAVREETEQEIAACLTPEEAEQFRALCLKLIGGLSERLSRRGDSVMDEMEEKLRRRSSSV